MEKHRLKRVVVAREGDGLGIISEKDIVRFASSDDTERTLDDMQAAEVMSKPLIAVHFDLPIPEIAKLMLEKGISSAVVSDGKRLERHHHEDRFLSILRSEDGRALRNQGRHEQESVQGKALSFNSTQQS